MPEEKQQEEIQEQETKAQEHKAQPKSEPKYTDEDVNRIVDKKFAEWSKKYEEKLAGEKEKITEAQKLEQMNEQEKAKYEHQKLEKENQELRAKLDFNEQKKIARESLSDAGINVSDALLNMIVSSDAEKTKASVTDFTKLFNEAINKGIQESLKRNPPKAEGTKRDGKSVGASYAEKYNQKNVPTK